MVAGAPRCVCYVYCVRRVWYGMVWYVMVWYGVWCDGGRQRGRRRQTPDLVAGVDEEAHVGLHEVALHVDVLGPVRKDHVAALREAARVCWRRSYYVGGGKAVCGQPWK